jgi:hypothetical protein
MKHKHHIIPRHMGGSDDPSNIIELTIEEHAEAHRKLYEEHGCWQDKVAWQGLSGIIPSKEVILEVQRNAASKPMTEETKKKISKSKTGSKQSSLHIENNRKAQTGKALSEEHKKHIRESLTGRVCSEEHKKRVGEKMKGRVMSQEWKQKLSDSKKGRTYSQETILRMKEGQKKRREREKQS